MSVDGDINVARKKITRLEGQKNLKQREYELQLEELDAEAAQADAQRKAVLRDIKLVEAKKSKALANLLSEKSAEEKRKRKREDDDELASAAEQRQGPGRSSGQESASTVPASDTDADQDSDNVDESDEDMYDADGTIEIARKVIRANRKLHNKSAKALQGPPLTVFHEEGRHFAVYLFVHTKHSQKAGPFSVARLKIDLPFHNRLAFTGQVPALLVARPVRRTHQVDHYLVHLLRIQVSAVARVVLVELGQHAAFHGAGRVGIFALACRLRSSSRCRFRLVPTQRLPQRGELVELDLVVAVRVCCPKRRLELLEIILIRGDETLRLTHNRVAQQR